MLHCATHAQQCSPTDHAATTRPAPQISAQELASAMGFLREQMGQEELRHLLEMLSVEAGAYARAAGVGSVGRLFGGQ